MTPALAVSLALTAFVLAALGLTAIVGRALVLRRRVMRAPDTFSCLVRVMRGDVPHLSHERPGQRFVARWRHDVLVLHRGFPVGWTVALPVTSAPGDVVTADAAATERLGPGAVVLRLRLDDDAVVAVAVAARSRGQLIGPFLGLAVRQLPPATPRRDAG